LTQVLSGFTGKIINAHRAFRRSLLPLLILCPNGPGD
jgi:hypothetical protein